MHYENLKRVFPEYKKKFYITGSPIVDYWNTFKKKNNENNRSNAKSIEVKIKSEDDKFINKLKLKCKDKFEHYFNTYI